MTLSAPQKQTVEDIISTSLRKKFTTHKPEPAVMPFHTRLLGKDRLALYSFIHSLNTNFGTTIFEPAAISIAKNNFKVAKSHVKAGSKVSQTAQQEIQNIINDLTAAGKKPDKNAEIKILRKVCQSGEMQTIKPPVIDVYLENQQGEIYLIDIKTAKPNKGGFKEFKRTLLEWAATELALNPNAKVTPLIAIPYNPYAPRPYERWTMAGVLDLEKELKVAEEFWDFLGGKGTYDDLLDCFENVGTAMRKEIDDYFAKFNAQL